MRKPWGHAPTRRPTSQSGRPPNPQGEATGNNSPQTTTEQLGRKPSGPAARPGSQQVALGSSSSHGFRPSAYISQRAPEIYPEVTFRPRCYLFPAGPASGVCRGPGRRCSCLGCQGPPPRRERRHSSYFLPEFDVRMTTCNCFAFRF